MQRNNNNNNNNDLLTLDTSVTHLRRNCSNLGEIYAFKVEPGG